MLKTFRRAFQIDDVRKRIFYTFLMLIVIRIGSILPTPGVDPTYIQNFFKSQTGEAFNFFSAFTGGSLERMSIFALSITPYITSSIIMQLLQLLFQNWRKCRKMEKTEEKKLLQLHVM